MQFDASLLVIMGIFWITYLILRSFFFRPLERIVDEREGEIEGARQLHEAALAETTASVEAERARLAQARVEAAARRDALRREAEEQRQRLLAEARAAAREQVEGAQAEIARDVETGRGTLAERARALADQMTERLLRRAS